MGKIFILLVLALIIMGFIWQGIYLPKEPGSNNSLVFSVKKGEGVKEVAINLERQGLIKSDFLFLFYTLIQRVAGKLQAGEYLLSPSMNIPQITRKIVSGEVIKIKVTFPEGFSLAEIEERLMQNGFNIKSKIKSQKAKIYKEEFKFLVELPEETNLQGYLFTDTYQFSYQATPEEIVRKMLSNFDKKLATDLREEIQKQGKTIFEVVTIASLIEKEVQTPEDKELVSGILWKRLEKGMPLQVDATITYITGKKTTKVPFEDLQVDSPYNTYKYKGLPSGPICNPGLDSIKGAIYPKDSPYWYYLSTPEGKTIFSETLTKHNFYKAKYLSQ
jgi:UPF0755 protein